MNVELRDRSEEILDSTIEFVLRQHVLRRKTKVLKGEESLGEGAYKADIVLNGEDILTLQLMRGCHSRVYRILWWRFAWSCKV